VSFMIVLAIALLLCFGYSRWIEMSRQAKSLTLVASGLYLVLLWYAYRWGDSQRFPDGPLFVHMENERRKKAAHDKPPDLPPPLTAQARLDAGGPSFVAVRYDATHVVFMVANGTEARFAEPASGHSSATLTRVSAPEKPAAQLAGMHELWEPESLSSLPELVKKMSRDEDKQWTLELSPDSSIAVTLEQPVIAPNGCALGAGFLASIAPAQQAAFGASSQEYFVIRRAPAQLADPVHSSNYISELRDWKSTPGFQQQMAALLTVRMKQELARIDATVRANMQNPNQPQPAWPSARVRIRPKEWLRLDARLVRDEGKLDYDVRAFRLTPDGAPRLFVRARWKLDDIPVFLMTAWFRESSKESSGDSIGDPSAGSPAASLRGLSRGSPKGSSSVMSRAGIRESAPAERSGREQRGSLRESRQADTSGRELLREARAESALESSRESVQSDHTDHPGAALQPILLSADSSWSAKLRDGEAPDDLGRTLDFQTILSEFDADHDGWAELLVYTVIPSNGGISANLTLNLYTDPGLAPLKATFHRDLSSPESCLDP
jgi:hypothetical protein